MKLTTAFFLAVLIFSGSFTGCASDRIIYARSSQAPEESAGFMRVGTEDPIPVTIDGHADAYAERSLAGFLVISEDDLQRLIQNTRELVEIKRGARSKGIDVRELRQPGGRAPD